MLSELLHDELMFGRKSIKTIQIVNTVRIRAVPQFPMRSIALQQHQLLGVLQTML